MILKAGAGTGAAVGFTAGNYSGVADVIDIASPYQGVYHLRLRSSTGYVERAVDLSSVVSAHLITHPEYVAGDAVIISFWVINSENNMRFFTERVFLRDTANAWN